MKLIINSCFYLAVMLFVSCSGTRTVTMNAMRPAEITFPPSVNTLLIVDRTKFSREAVNILEGILTGEMPGQDKAAVQALISSFQNRLSYSPRFASKVAVERLDGNSVTAAFPDQLSWSKIESLCKQYSSDAIVSIEMFDTDFIITNGKRIVKKKITEGDVKKEIEVDEYFAEGVGNIIIGIRLYDPVAQSIVDQQLIKKSNTWTARGDNLKTALAQLIDKSEATRYLGENAGSDYAYKIAPMPVKISRMFFGKSKKAPELEQGGRLADVDKWQEAADKWESGIKRSPEKEAGQLAYNTAIAYEVLGDFDRAREWAQIAYVDYGNKDARSYSNTLLNRMRQEERVNEQLK
jgi:tetratricopeptide (TPR) repeat protein